MIHGGSNHPILIKKINLRIWCLRDEVETVLKARLLDYKDSENPPPIEDLIKEYSPKELVKEETLEDDGQQGENEDEQKANLSVVEDEQESSEDDESEDSEDNLESDMAKAMVEGQDQEEVKETSVIYHRRPKLPKNKVYSGQAVLSEIDMQFLNFFSNHRFLSGQSIVIEFLVPKRFIINADVAFCRSFNMHSRIISENRHPYRIAARFTFLRPGERTLLRSFVSSIEPEIAPPASQALKKAASNEGQEDDIDDLDEFDF